MQRATQPMLDADQAAGSRTWLRGLYYQTAPGIAQEMAAVQVGRAGRWWCGAAAGWLEVAWVVGGADPGVSAAGCMVAGPSSCCTCKG